MKKIIYAACLGIIGSSFIGCDKKDTSRECTYFNRPETVKVGFVDYFDYEIDRVILLQYSKNSNYSNLVRADTFVYTPMPKVMNDTSVLLFDLSNKADYIINLPNIKVDYKVGNLNYQDEYYTVTEASGECKTENFSQKATTAVVDNITTTLDNSTEQTKLFLGRQ